MLSQQSTHLIVLRLSCSLCLLLFAITIVLNDAADQEKEIFAAKNNRGWYYGQQRLCGSATYRHIPLAIELHRKELLIDSLKSLLFAYQHCGVTVLNQLLTAAESDTLHQQLLQLLQPYLESRQRIRNYVKSLRDQHRRRHQDPLRQRGFAHPDDIFTDTKLKVYDEIYLHAHSWLAERNDGRIDVTISHDVMTQLHAMSCTNCTTGSELLQQLQSGSMLMQLLRHVLGAKMELKSMHLVLALPHSEGCDDQHWHRDDALLFDSDEVSDAVTHQQGHFQLMASQGEENHHLQHHVATTEAAQPGAAAVDVHARGAGVHLPAYALNVFVPLVDLVDENGPTEFTLGSHMWGSVWADDEEAEEIFTGGGFRDEVMRNVSRGSAYIADYRTIHRGTMNRSPHPRPVLMLIYGRRWWKDSTNYEPPAASTLPLELLKRVESRISASESSAKSEISNCMSDNPISFHARDVTTLPGACDPSEYREAPESQFEHSQTEYEIAYTVYRNLVRKWNSSLK